MVDLLYLSHTAVPSHLTELDGLGLLEPGEQVLAAFDGVLLDGEGRRIGGPTLHDYCLLTNMRVLLWARDYGRHLCYAFPLADLCLVEGTGLDPMHAHLHMAFAGPEEDEEQHFALILLPLMDLSAGIALLQLAAQTAIELTEQGLEPQEAASEITTVLGMHIFGTENGRRPQGKFNRGVDAEARRGDEPPFQGDQMGVPVEIYSAGRLGRAAWDTFRRTLRETELPLNLNGGDLRDLADTLRAMNELLSTLAGNPGAREVAMAFLSRRSSESKPSPHPSPSQERAHQNVRKPDSSWHEPAQSVQSDYHEIPLRQNKSDRAAVHTDRSDSERTSIPLRRRGDAHRSAPTGEVSDAERTSIPLRRRSNVSHDTPDANSFADDQGNIPLRRGNNGKRPSAKDPQHQYES